MTRLPYDAKTERYLVDGEWINKEDYHNSMQDKKKESTMNKRQRLAALKAEEEYRLRQVQEIAELEAELAKRPKEPPVDSVIAFKHLFTNLPGEKAYDYVAFQAVEGAWYLTQARYINSKGLPAMKWDDLLDFIEEGLPEDEQIYIVQKWGVL